MIYFELLFGRKSNYCTILNLPLFGRNDPILSKKTYGIGIYSQFKESIFPTIVFHFGSNEYWFNQKGFEEEETIYTPDKEDEIIHRTFEVDGFEYEMYSGYVHTVSKLTGLIKEQKVPAWLLCEHQWNKTPLGSLRSITMWNRRGVPQDPCRVIKSVINLTKTIDSTRSAMES